jgi:hypothetical protein
MFINLEMDPRIPHSSPRRACVNLPPPIAFGLLLTSALGLPLTSALGHSLDSHSHLHSDITWTPAHVRTRSLLKLLLTSALGLYSEPRSSSVIHPPLRSTRLPHCNPTLTYTDPTRSSVSIRAMSSRNTTRASARTFRSVICSDIRVSIRLTSPSPHLWTPFGPLSSSALQSEPLSSNSARRSARASARTSVSCSVLRVRAHAFGARSDLCHCLHYECCMDPNRS